jgi:hypothetical protein
MTGIGAAMAGGNPTEGRQKNDFYPTPPEVTHALMRAQTFTGEILEPACGDGSMARVIASYGHTVRSSDLIDRGYGEVKDFFEITEAENIITNPPFDLAVRFIEHGLSLNPRKMALVLKASFWHAIRRWPLFQKHPPMTVHPLLWRPDFLNKGAPTMEVMWCVWDRHRERATTYEPLEKGTIH